MKRLSIPILSSPALIKDQAVRLWAEQTNILLDKFFRDIREMTEPFVASIDEIDVPSGVTTDEDVEARAAIESILDVLKARSLTE